MKTLLIFIICFCLNSQGYSQIIGSLDKVTPFNDEFSAVKKGDKWGFINKNGTLVVDFRSDFVLNKTKSNNPHPIFVNERCLIKQLINDVSYYGFINTNGEKIIPATFLNASQFKDGYAIVSVLLKDSIGFNKVLQKSISSYEIEEYVIDKSGTRIKYLENPLNYNITKLKSQTPPKLRSKFIAPHLVAVLKKNQKWDIYKF
ncbi:WG repeat-containing protein [Lutibacter citreus]|uniref:WG repeat-containing protein n=1 Tax=Lutibacter citreus TaxID=2138210 RepID=UPI000DBE47E7|nr:WG repeat-containing protein [Lutibacter citreus]